MEISAEFLPSDAQDAHTRLVRICEVNGRFIAAAAPPVPAYLPAADGIVESASSRSGSVRAAGIPEGGKRVLLAGCDPALSLLAGALAPSGFEIVNVPASSRRALEWLKQGKIHAAGTHLRDRRSGDYNLPIIQRLFPAAAVRVVTFAAWEEGLTFRSGNPKNIQSIADFARRHIRIINREKGSGSRDLLDTGLAAAGIPADSVRGYDEIAPGHLAAAMAVSTGAADCCIATRSAAHCFGLGFHPLTPERFDLAISTASLQLPAMQALLDTLNRSILHNRLRTIAGYDTSQTGKVLM